jgi:large subunit ribosomal protein L11
MIQAALKIEKGSGTPNTVKVGKISKAQVRKIAEEKLKDLNTRNVESAMRVVEGTARSMGVTVEG